METVKEVMQAVDAAKDREKNSPVTVYSWGLFYCSVCAPAEMTAEQIERETNAINVCGTSKGWTIADQEFSGGQSNPCACDSDPARKHWLLAA